MNAPIRPASNRDAASTSRRVLDVEGVSVTFHGRAALPWKRSTPVRAVRDASIGVDNAETLGLVGESGSGKSTLGRAILRLTPTDAGRIVADTMDVTGFGRNVPLGFRQQVQVVWQDPYSSLNPTMTIRQTLAEPLRLHRGLSGTAIDEAATDLMERVGLSGSQLDRHPHEFSGGQRQRIAIARALAPNPQLVILDEAVSALDVSTQAQIISLLRDLQRDLGVAYLFIAHDLAVVRQVSDRIAVMYRGRIVETGPAEELCARPRHPYSKALLAASPVPDPVLQRARREARLAVAVNDEVPTPTSGCPFAPQCPSAMAICAESMPPTSDLSDGFEVACYLYGDEGRDDPASVGDSKDLATGHSVPSE